MTNHRTFCNKRDWAIELDNPIVRYVNSYIGEIERGFERGNAGLIQAAEFEKLRFKINDETVPYTRVTELFKDQVILDQSKEKIVLDLNAFHINPRDLELKIL